MKDLEAVMVPTELDEDLKAVMVKHGFTMMVAICKPEGQDADVRGLFLSEDGRCNSLHLCSFLNFAMNDAETRDLVMDRMAAACERRIQSN